MNTIKVNLPSKNKSSYPIIIDEGLLSRAYDYIKENTSSKRFLIISNPTIWNLWEKELNIPNSEVFLIPDGEKYKNFKTLNSILDRAFELKFDRKSCFVAFGGGVIGDITGFAASIFERGIDYIQIPTTLLAQVDSSVGGKTAVNNIFGKNLIGTFYQPKLVLADTKTLNTLDERQFKTGLAEVVKYAFIEKNCGKRIKFFEFLKANKEKILKRDLNLLNTTVESCCILKAAIVNKDERESGIRAVLNFGHTYAHALEKMTNYKVFTHGEAVAIGLQVALDYSFALNLISEKYYKASSDLISGFNFIIPEHKKIKPSNLLNAMYFDKKNQNGKIRFVLANGKNKVGIYENPDKELLLKIIS